MKEDGITSSKPIAFWRNGEHGSWNSKISLKFTFLICPHVPTQPPQNPICMYSVMPLSVCMVLLPTFRQKANITTHVSFIMARSCIAPKHRLSIPCLELCAAPSGTQLANLLSSELTITLQSVILWTDSKTIPSWRTSESCHYKVFVGTRIAEIQTMTDRKSWRYVDSKNNPADDLTRGKTLLELSQQHRWSQGHPFLLQKTNCWPANPCVPAELEPVEELRKSMFCGAVMSDDTNLPDLNKNSSWDDLMKETKNVLYGAADHNSNIAQCYIHSERHLLQRA